MNREEKIDMVSNNVQEGMYGVMAEYEGNKVPVVIVFNSNGQVLSEFLGISNIDNIPEMLDIDKDSNLESLDTLRRKFVRRVETRNFNNADTTIIQDVE